MTKLFLCFNASLVAVVLSLSGCSSTPDQFYMLTPDGKMPASRTAGESAIGIGPVIIPDYIDRAELVFQSAPNQFEVPPEHRWAGALDKTIADVLVTNIAHRLNSGAVYSYPWDASLKPARTVAVRIRQFHAMSGGDAVLDVGWEISDSTSGKVTKRGSQLFTAAVEIEGYAGVVQAESQLLAQFADAVAAMLK